MVAGWIGAGDSNAGGWKGSSLERVVVAHACEVIGLSTEVVQAVDALCAARNAGRHFAIDAVITVCLRVHAASNVYVACRNAQVCACEVKAHPCGTSSPSRGRGMLASSRSFGRVFVFVMSVEECRKIKQKIAITYLSGAFMVPSFEVVHGCCEWARLPQLGTKGKDVDVPKVNERLLGEIDGRNILYARFCDKKGWLWRERALVPQ